MAIPTTDHPTAVSKSEVEVTRHYPKIVLSGVLLLLIFARGSHPSLIPGDAVTIGLALVALLPWLPAVLDTAELPGGWKFAFRKLEEKTETLQTELDATRDRLQRHVLNSMSPKTLSQLIKINSGNFGKYWLGVGLSRELSYLENIGYIAFSPPCKGIDDIPQDGSNTPRNLSEFVTIAPQGVEYLALRRVVSPDTMKAFEDIVLSEIDNT